MKKPEKKIEPDEVIPGNEYADGEVEGYNQACDDWEEWFKDFYEQTIRRMQEARG